MLALIGVNIILCKLNYESKKKLRTRILVQLACDCKCNEDVVVEKKEEKLKLK